MATCFKVTSATSSALSRWHVSRGAVDAKHVEGDVTISVPCGAEQTPEAAIQSGNVVVGADGFLVVPADLMND
jgi:hypothetical protein